MANVVEIQVKANTTQATAGLKQFGGQLNQVVQGLTGFSFSALGGVGAVVALGNEIKKAVSQYSDYAFAMGKAADLSGITAEEMSRLTQAADDAFVSQEKLTSAFGIALKNGFVPTIENIAKLSDELLAMKDPAERAEKASKIFGRGWAEIAPFLLKGGDAIRANTAAIADGMIVTDDAVKANIKYKESLDTLNDSWTSLQNQVAGPMIPYLTAFVNALNNYEENQRRVNQALGTNLALNPLIVAAYGLARQGSEDYREALEFEDQALRLLPDTVDRVTAGMSGYNAVVMNQSSVTDAANTAVRNFNLEMDRIAGEMAGITESITTAQNDLATAQANWQSGSGNDTRALLEAQGLKGDKLIDALAGVDDVMGTSLATQEQYNQRLEAVTKEFAKSGDLDKFKSSLEGIKDGFMPLNEQVIEATAKLQELQAQFNALDGQRARMYIDVIQNGLGGSGGYTGGPPPSSGYTIPPATVAPPPSSTPTRTPVTGPTPFSISVNNNVDASKVASLIALEIQRRK